MEKNGLSDEEWSENFCEQMEEMVKETRTRFGIKLCEVTKNHVDYGTKKLCKKINMSEERLTELTNLNVNPTKDEIIALEKFFGFTNSELWNAAEGLGNEKKMRKMSKPPLPPPPPPKRILREDVKVGGLIDKLFMGFIWISCKILLIKK